MAAVSGAGAVELEQAGGAGGHERDDQHVKPLKLAVEELGAAAEFAQRQQRVVADHAARVGPQRGQPGDQLCRAMAGEPGPDAVRAGQDQGPGLVDRLGPLGAGGALSDHQRPDRLHRAIAPSWRPGRPAGLGGAGSTDRIERI